MKQIKKSLRVAVDVGGTFTDVVKLDSDNNTISFEKVPTTPQAPTEGVLASFDRIDARLSEIESFTHGTTLGLNSLLINSRYCSCEYIFLPLGEYLAGLNKPKLSQRCRVLTCLLINLANCPTEYILTFFIINIPYFAKVLN